MINYQTLKIVEAFPDALSSVEGMDEEFCRLRGAKIVRIGSTNDADLEGGGLLIDYVPLGDAAVHRVVFAFNERGLWMEAALVLPMVEAGKSVDS